MLKRTLAALAAAATPAAADLYTPAELAIVEPWRAAIEDVVRLDVVANLAPAERAAAEGVTLAFPAAAGPHPLGFYASPKTRTILVPLASVRFLDDLAILFAYGETGACRRGYIDTYLWALLRDGHALPPPLAAFGIDRDAALADPFVLDVATKTFDSAMLFLLAHEVGHLVLAHTGGLAGQASRSQEIAADAFALDAFAALGAPPLGIVVYFYAARWLDPTGATGRAASTHPVFSDRLTAIADRLAAEPASFTHAEPDPARAAAAVAAVSGEIARLAELGAGDDMLDLLPLGLARDFPVSGIGAACAP